MKNFKKVLVTLVAAMLLVVVSVGATLAFLTSQDSVKNTFTVGNVKITLDEARVNLDGEPLAKEGNVVENVAGAERVAKNEYHLLPGHKYVKDPTVTVEDKSEESYIRLLVTINKKSALDAIGVNTLEVFTGYDASEWPLNNEKAVGDTMVYEFRYKTTVSTMTGGAKKLDPLFDAMVIPTTVKNDQLATLNEMTIDIVAQAIQADGFESADAAWAAWEDRQDDPAPETAPDTGDETTPETGDEE